MDDDNILKEMSDQGMGAVTIAPGVAIGALALNMAMKYHDMSMVSDGTLYQQYKLEGRNMREIGLADVFDTAIQIEAHLLGSSERIASMVVEALVYDGGEETPETEAPVPEEVTDND